MPVHFAHCAGGDGYEGGGEVGGDGEGGCVDYLYGAAGDGVGFLLGEVVGVGIFLGEGTGGTGLVLCGDVRWGRCTVEYVKLIRG